MAKRQVPYNEGRQYSNSGQGQSTRGASPLETFPSRKKRSLVDMPVDPIAVLEIILEKRVDDVERGENAN